MLYSKNCENENWRCDIRPSRAFEHWNEYIHPNLRSASGTYLRPVSGTSRRGTAAHRPSKFCLSAGNRQKLLTFAICLEHLDDEHDAEGAAG